MVAKLVNKLSGNAIEINKNKISLGRGAATECLDKRISRQHVTISHFCDDAVSIYVLNTNPCFIMEKGEPPIRILKKNDTATLRNGDILSLLPDFQTCAFEVVIENLNHLNGRSNTNFNVKTELRNDRSVTPVPIIPATDNGREAGVMDATDLDVTNCNEEEPSSPSLIISRSNFNSEIERPNVIEWPDPTATDHSEQNANHSTTNINKDNDGSIDKEPSSPSLLLGSIPSSIFDQEMECGANFANPRSDAGHTSNSRPTSDGDPLERPPTPVTPDICPVNGSLTSDGDSILLNLPENLEALNRIEAVNVRYEVQSSSTEKLVAIKTEPVEVPSSNKDLSTGSNICSLKGLTSDGDSILLNLPENLEALNRTEAYNVRDEVQSSSTEKLVAIKTEPVEVPSANKDLSTGSNICSLKGRRLSDDNCDSTASPAKRPALSSDATSINAVTSSDQVLRTNDVTPHDGSCSSSAGVTSCPDDTKVVIKPDPDTSRANRPLCRYAHSCYRRNVQHKSEYSHPGDPDWIPENAKPLCPFDPNCYRRCPDHRINMRHTCDRRPYPDGRTPSLSPEPSQDDDGDDDGDVDNDEEASQSEFTSSVDFSDSGSNYSDMSDNHDYSSPVSEPEE